MNDHVIYTHKFRNGREQKSYWCGGESIIYGGAKRCLGCDAPLVDETTYKERELLKELLLKRREELENELKANDYSRTPTLALSKEYQIAAVDGLLRGMGG